MSGPGPERFQRLDNGIWIDTWWVCRIDGDETIFEPTQDYGITEQL